MYIIRPPEKRPQKPNKMTCESRVLIESSDISEGGVITRVTKSDDSSIHYPEYGGAVQRLVPQEQLLDEPPVQHRRGDVVQHCAGERGVA